uniref:Uncharacterized protein n=1 Tax=viral metagenome TaxID=1070528 RepID=A0A6C0AN16_9ZZZZ
MKLASFLGMLLAVTLVGLVVLHFSKARSYAPRMLGGSARLPCLANNHCPMGQKCSDGFCSEGFMAPISVSTDMSSCSAKECNGINAPCARKGAPCPEGTFCQNNGCVNITAADQGEAYGQIGMLL